MNVFSNISDNESLYIFLWLLGAFLIGLIVGWFIWGTAKRALEAELADLREKYKGLIGDHDTLKVEMDGLVVSKTELQKEYDWKAERLHDIETEKGDLHTEIYGLKDKLKKEVNSKLALGSQIDGLNASYNGAKSEVEVLELKVKGLESELQAAEKTYANWEAKLKAMKADLAATTNAKTALESQLNETKMSYGATADASAALESDLATAKETIESLSAKIAGLEGDITEYKGLVINMENTGNELEAANNANAELKAKIAGLEGDITEYKGLVINMENTGNELEAANNANAELKANLEGLTANMESTVNELAAVNNVNEELKVTVEDLEGNISQYKDLIANLQGTEGDLKAANTRIAVLEGKLEGLQEQFEATKEELAVCNASKAELHATAMMAAAATEEKAEISVEDAKTAITAALASIGFASVDDKDDLTRIKGVGEFIEGKLNNLGVYKFKQIAKFDDDMVANVTRAIEFFPGRIERDQWVAQAKVFAGEEDVMSGSIEVEGAPVSKIDPETAREKVRQMMMSSQFPVASAEDKDDLKVISGVGPFIEDKLNNLGIYTYEQIGLFDTAMVNNITNAIEFFPGRIERDQWVKQAKALFDAKNND